MSASPFFNPSPERALLVMDDLVDPDLSLRSVAARHNTTIAALSLWIALPETTDDLAILHTAFSDRTRLLAAAASPSSIASLSRILDRLNLSDRTPDPALSPMERIRALELTYRAAAALLRLTNFRPAPLGSTRQPAPSSTPTHRDPPPSNAAPHPSTSFSTSTPNPGPPLSPLNDLDDASAFADLESEPEPEPDSHPLPGSGSGDAYEQSHALSPPVPPSPLKSEISNLRSPSLTPSSAPTSSNLKSEISNLKSPAPSPLKSEISNLRSPPPPPKPILPTSNSLDLFLASLSTRPLPPSKSKRPHSAPALLAAAHEHWP